MEHDIGKSWLLCTSDSGCLAWVLVSVDEESLVLIQQTDAIFE